MKKIHGHTVDDIVDIILTNLEESRKIYHNPPYEYPYMKYNSSHFKNKTRGFVRRFLETDDRVSPIKSSKDGLDNENISLMFRYAALGRFFSGFHDHTLGSGLAFLMGEYISQIDSRDIGYLIKRLSNNPEQLTERLKTGKYIPFPESARKLGDKIWLQNQSLAEIYHHYICRELTHWGVFWEGDGVPDSHPVKQTNEFINLGKLFDSYMDLIKYALIDQVNMVRLLDQATWSSDEKEERLSLMKNTIDSMMGIRDYIKTTISDESNTSSNIYQSFLDTSRFLFKRKELRWRIGKSLEKYLEALPRNLEVNLKNNELNAIILNLLNDYKDSVTIHNKILNDSFRKKHGINKHEFLSEELRELYDLEVNPNLYNWDIGFEAKNNTLKIKFKDYHPSNKLINRIGYKILGNIGSEIEQNNDGFSLTIPIRKSPVSIDSIDSEVEKKSTIQEHYQDTTALYKDLSILLVEDDKRFLSPMVGWMQSVGFGNIYTAQNIQDAQRIYNSTDLDAVILDLNLPKSKNKEVTDDIGFKFAKKIQDLPIIYSTVAASDHVNKKARNMRWDSQVNRVERKPYKIVEKGVRSQYIDALTQLLNLKQEKESITDPTSTYNSDYLGKKILIVDDQDNFLSTLENILIDMGVPQAQIYKASNGKQAIEYLEKNPDTALTITDLRMPEVDGIQFLAIYSHTFENHKPVIVVTGSYSNEEAASLLQDQSLGERPLNLKYTLKGQFFSDNIRRLVHKALMEPDNLKEVEIKVPESLDILPKVHALEYLEEVASKRRGELYVLETNKKETQNLIHDNGLSKLVACIKTEFIPPKSLDLTDQHSYKTEIAAILVDNQEVVRKVEAKIKSMYEQKQIPMSDYAKILSNLSLIEQATENAYRYTVQIVRNLAEIDETVIKEVDLNTVIQTQLVDSYKVKFPKVKFLYESSIIPKLHTSEKSLVDGIKAILDNAVSYGNEVNIEAREDQGKIYLRISDNGPGIKPEHQDNIFNPLFTTRSDQGGTGVGLGLAQNIVNRLGGSLYLVPQKKGACFEIMLDAA